MIWVSVNRTPSLTVVVGFFVLVATLLTFETTELLILPAEPAVALLLRRLLGASFRATAAPVLSLRPLLFRQPF
jgi:hypothetical protein